MPPLDYKKQARRLYLPSAVPAVVDVPEMQFFMVDGTGRSQCSGRRVFTRPGIIDTPFPTPSGWEGKKELSGSGLSGIRRPSLGRALVEFGAKPFRR